MSATGGWYPDPFGRHELRYHNGTRWTGDVATHGVQSVDPPERLASGGPAAPTGGTPEGDRAAVVAFVFGLVGACLAWLPVVVVLGAISSLVALGVARRARSSVTARRTGLLQASRILGIVGLILVVPGLVLTRVLFDVLSPGAYEVEITSCTSDAGRAVLDGTIVNQSDSETGYVILVSFLRAGTTSVLAGKTVQVDDIAPGDSAEFVAAVSLDVVDVDCEIAEVLGGLPIEIG